MNDKEEHDIVNIIGDDNFEDIYYSDNYNEDGNALGYAVVNEIGYSFIYNITWGIHKSSIEEDKDAFEYIEAKNINNKREYEVVEVVKKTDLIDPKSLLEYLEEERDYLINSNITEEYDKGVLFVYKELIEKLKNKNFNFKRGMKNEKNK